MKIDKKYSEQLLANTNKAEFVMVTGADSSHFKSLCQFLSSLHMYEPDLKTIVFDLGLHESENQYLEERFPWTEIRFFDFTQYPDYFNIKVRAGEYAWKPIILHDLFNEFKCCVCWMDAGNLIIESLRSLQNVTQSAGVYTPHSCGVISDWTHPGTIEYMCVSDTLLQKQNLNAACVAVCYESLEARELMFYWKNCALTKKCIAPEGSSRRNHRQDQAVLTVLAHQLGLVENMPTRLFGFKIQQDID
jgi:hypothetical protein